MQTVRHFETPSDGKLTPDMVSAFHADGFLVLENFAGKDEIATLRAAIDRLVAGFDPESVRTIFSTSERSHAADRYFQESGDKISFFFEAGAFDDHGELIADKDQALNKIGHNLHDLDSDFDHFFRQEKLARISTGLGLKDPGLVQSMVIFKQPKIGGEVGMHQDATFLSTEPVSVTGFWLALEDADETNGCLLALPGGHKGALKERFHYQEQDLIMENLAETDWPEDQLVPLCAPAGTLVILHGKVPHGSAPNTSERSRQAVTLHVVDRAATWLEDNWLRRAEDMPVKGFE